MTSDFDWDPTLYDNTVSNLPQFCDPEVDEIHHSNFDEQGNYLHWTVAIHSMEVEYEYFDVQEYAGYEDIVDDSLIHVTHHWYKTSTRYRMIR
jgi:hypothetical protein